jgi:hypothetical protein
MSTPGTSLIRCTLVHAHLFWSIRRNRLLAVGLGLLGILFFAGIHHFMRAMVDQGVLAAEPAEVSKLAIRNLIPVYAVMTILGLHVVASDRRAGTLGWRASLLGRTAPLHQSVWLLGVTVCTLVTALVTGVAAAYQGTLWRQSAAAFGPAVAVDALLLFGALLYFFAWGVLISSFTSELWIQMVAGFVVPWIGLPIVRASFVAAAPDLWAVLRPLVPFESALSLSAWAARANPLINEGGGAPYPQVVSCLLLIVASMVCAHRRMGRGRIDE